MKIKLTSRYYEVSNNQRGLRCVVGPVGFVKHLLNLIPKSALGGDCDASVTYEPCSGYMVDRL